MERKYKDPSNKVHQIDERFTHLLPSGCVEITNAEADAILHPQPTQEQLDNEASDKAKADLAALAIECIPDIVAWIARQPGAPVAISDSNARISVVKAKIKP